MIKIAVDVMGTDLGIKPIIEALKSFTDKYFDVCFLLIGDRIKIKNYLNNYDINSKYYEILHTTEVIEMTDSILEARRKKNSSMMRGAELLRDDSVDVFISGGSTAAYLAICHFVIGEIENISRPGFMSFISTVRKNKSVIMIDVGANLENDSKDLLGFALMAIVYANTILNLNNPRVALLNIGEEFTKGKEYHKETYELLKKRIEINFIGNIEARDIMSDKADIIVTDGFTGNMVLKAIEGTAKNLISFIKKELTKNFICKIKAFFLGKIINNIRETFDYRNNASALIMGLNKIAIKTHGSSDKKSWFSTFVTARSAVINNFIVKIKNITI